VQAARRVKLPDLPRMADLARFGEAVGHGLGWRAGTFIAACKTPSILSNALRPLAPQLRAHGMNVAFSKTHQSRMITIQAAKTLATSRLLPNWPIASLLRFAKSSAPSRNPEPSAVTHK